jgi:hypothetical protein
VTHSHIVKGGEALSDMDANGTPSPIGLRLPTESRMENSVFAMFVLKTIEKNSHSYDPTWGFGVLGFKVEFRPVQIALVFMTEHQIKWRGRPTIALRTKCTKAVKFSRFCQSSVTVRDLN